MNKPKVENVDTYLTYIEDPKRQILEKIRHLCNHILKDYKETIEYNMPCYKKNNQVEVAFANQKHYISLYILKNGIIEKYKPYLKSTGKGCIRYKNIKDIDFTLIKKILQDVVLSNGLICK